jgi:hypothetical protein
MMAERRLKKSYRSVSGFYPSKKLGRLVQFDSALERDCILLLDFHPAVRSFAEQPVRIPWKVGSEPRIYVPDFRIQFRAGAVFLGRRTRTDWVVEVKYRNEVTETFPILRPKLRAGFRYSSTLSCTFRILTDLEIRGVALQNAMFLKKYLDQSVSPEVLVDICSVIGTVEHATPREIARILSPQLGTDQSYRLLWYAIAAQRVQFDIERALVVDSPIWVGGERWQI